MFGEDVNRVAAVVSSIVVALAATQMATVSSANAAPTRFTSCDALHKYYKYGISKDKQSQLRAVREGMYKPALQPRVYADSYKTLDRDKDGTMCEVPR